jgi:1-acyl-sn-glycerol-3-phosphate acyltransferase
LDAWYNLRIVGITLAASARARRGRYTLEAFSDSSYDTLKLAEGCRAQLQVEGARNIGAGGGPVVVMGNHMSMFETYGLPVILLSFREIATVVKESLLTYPVFGPVMRAQNPISVTRRDPREDLKSVMRGGLENLEQGRSVLLFPQATRSVVLHPDQMNSLAVKLAKRAGVPLVPLALKTDFQGVGKLVRDFGPLDRSRRIHFAFGEPMTVEGNGKEQHARAIDFIAGNLRGWGGEVDDGTHTGT